MIHISVFEFPVLFKKSWYYCPFLLKLPDFFVGQNYLFKTENCHFSKPRLPWSWLSATLHLSISAERLREARKWNILNISWRSNSFSTSNVILAWRRRNWRQSCQRRIMQIYLIITPKLAFVGLPLLLRRWILDLDV